MQHSHTHRKPSTTCWLALAAVALAGVYATRSPAPASPASDQASARWIWTQIETNPARYRDALTCVGAHTEHDGTDWTGAAGCYRRLVDR